MTPLSVIHLAPESLAQVEKFAVYIQEQLENGSIDPLDVYTRCKAMSKAMEACIAILQEKATEEAQKYGKSFEKNNAQYKVSEVGVKYVFDNCNDPKYFRNLVACEEAKKKLDERAKFLKTLKSPEHIVDEETGEVAVIYPPVKTSKTSVTVELK